MAAIRGMMACSLDGFVAEGSGNVGFLDRFNTVDWGYADFLAQIGTVVLGRKTYEETLHLAESWPYPNKRSIIVGRGLTNLPPGTVGWTEGLAALVATLRDLTDGDVWLVGGPMLQAALLRLGALDRMELCIVPHLLGGGIAAFPPGPYPVQPRLAGTRALPLGMVMLDYRFTPD